MSFDSKMGWSWLSELLETGWNTAVNCKVMQLGTSCKNFCCQWVLHQCVLTDKRQHEYTNQLRGNCVSAVIWQWKGPMWCSGMSNREVSDALALARPPWLSCVYSRGQLSLVKSCWSTCVAQMNVGSGELCPWFIRVSSRVVPSRRWWL